MIDLLQALSIAKKAADAAAQVIREKFGDASNARIKGVAQGLVTDTDLEAEKAIFEILTNESDFNILSEESGWLNETDGPKWVVDPLDGTTNFARGVPLFVTSIGLMKDKEFIVGVIKEPVSGNEYSAVKGGGAFRNDEKIILPKFQKDFMPAIFLNHGYAEFDRNKFKRMVEQTATSCNVLKLGTTALELCYVATGSMDAFICSGDAVWDFAGGAVIATEAGCKFTDWKGNSWDGKGSQLLIARPEVHEQLVNYLKPI